MAFRNRRFEKRSRKRNRRRSGDRRSTTLFSTPSVASRAKNGVLYGLGALAVLFLFLFLFFNVFGGGANVKLKNDLKAEIGSHIVASSFVEEIKEGHISKDQAVDTSSLGKKTCRITVQSGEKEKDYEFTVTIVDTQEPVIGVGDELFVARGMGVDIAKQSMISDNSGETPETTVSGTWDVNAVGDYSVKISATDSSGNKTKKDITLKVVDPNEASTYSFVTDKGFVADRKDGITQIDGIIVVNRSFSLPSSFAPGIQEEARTAFYEMAEAADKEEVSLWIINDFRSWEEQDEIYKDYYSTYGADADTMSARPGHSEHQSGFALDLNSFSTDFGGTKEGKWIAEHAWEYGFIMRYPEGKENLTGYKAEPWHVRYVGKDLAKTLYNNGDWITLEEHFGIDSSYKN